MLLVLKNMLEKLNQVKFLSLIALHQNQMEFLEAVLEVGILLDMLTLLYSSSLAIYGMVRVRYIVMSLRELVNFQTKFNLVHSRNQVIEVLKNKVQYNSVQLIVHNLIIIMQEKSYGNFSLCFFINRNSYDHIFCYILS